MKKKVLILIALFGSMSYLISAQSISNLISDRHKCCSASFETTDSDGLPSRYRVYQCREDLGNSPTSSEDAKADACEAAKSMAAILQAGM